MAFKIGDYVKLNSGGPRMIVVDSKAETIICSWKDGIIYQEAAFDPSCIHLEAK